MSNTMTAASRHPRALPMTLSLFLALSALGSLAPAASAAEPTESPPAATVSAEPSPTVQEALCERAETLGLVVDFLRETSATEGGLLPALVGAIAALSVARDLASLAGETYRPLVDDLITTLQGLRTSAEASSDDETLGARIAAVGVAISEIGIAMDALQLALSDPCPTPAS